MDFVSCWKVFKKSTGNTKRHDQSCDRASYWTSVACVSIGSDRTSLLFCIQDTLSSRARLAWRLPLGRLRARAKVSCIQLASLLRISSNWKSRASPCCRVSSSCLLYVRRLSCMCLLTVWRVSLGWLSSG